MRSYGRIGRRTQLAAAATVALGCALCVAVIAGFITPRSDAGSGTRPAVTESRPAGSHVPGEKYQICDEKAQYLTSP